MPSVWDMVGAYQTPQLSVDVEKRIALTTHWYVLRGGYVAMRHNALRDLNANLQKEVCRDVVVEPKLLPLENEIIDGTTADRAAPDISSRGIWSTFERTFFDVKSSAS